MNSSLDSATAFINASLAPAVLFTGVGLLLAGLQAKYSVIVGVIRQMNGERRRISRSQEQDDPERMTILTSQIDSLMRRARLVRNSICSFYLTIFFLVASSLLLGFHVLGLAMPTPFVYASFGAALASLFGGVGFATREALLSFQIVQIEVKKWIH